MFDNDDFIYQTDHYYTVKIDYNHLVKQCDQFQSFFKKLFSIKESSMIGVDLEIGDFNSRELNIENSKGIIPAEKLI